MTYLEIHKNVTIYTCNNTITTIYVYNQIKKMVFGAHAQFLDARFELRAVRARVIFGRAI